MFTAEAAEKGETWRGSCQRKENGCEKTLAALLRILIIRAERIQR